SRCRAGVAKPVRKNGERPHSEGGLRADARLASRRSYAIAVHTPETTAGTSARLHAERGLVGIAALDTTRSVGRTAPYLGVAHEAQCDVCGHRDATEGNRRAVSGILLQAGKLDAPDFGGV